MIKLAEIFYYETKDETLIKWNENISITLKMDAINDIKIQIEKELFERLNKNGK